MTKKPLAGALLAAAVILCAWAGQASAYVYWTNDATAAIGRASLDGSAPNPTFITGAEGLTDMVSVDGQHIYWTNAGNDTIAHADLDGTGVNQSFIAGANSPSGVATDAQHVYWVNTLGDAIGRANLDGTGVNQSFITGANSPVGLAIDGQHIYWVNHGTNTIGRANLDGSGVDQSLVTGANGLTAVAVDQQHIYWSNGSGDAIGRANLDGTGVNQSFITGANSPAGVAVDDQHIYWANSDSASIGRADLDGTGVNQRFITGAANAFGLAVDGGPAGIATASPASVDFPSQPLGTYGDALPITVTNTGHGMLRLDAARVTSGDGDDFVISADECAGASVPVEGMCTISVRFGPSATGARSATLTLAGNDPDGPLPIVLSGDGTAPPILAPGPPGAAGPIGRAGAVGRPGIRGATGPAGTTSKNGLTELVTCRTVMRTIVTRVHGKRRKAKVTRQVCTTKAVAKPIIVKRPSAPRAVLTRAGITYARGIELRAGNRPRLLLDDTRPMPRGTYTLKLRWTDRRHRSHSAQRRLAIR
jgi:sugar lactone lactonase YvrE